MVAVVVPLSVLLVVRVELEGLPNLAIPHLLAAAEVAALAVMVLAGGLADTAKILAAAIPLRSSRQAAAEKAS